MSLSEKHRLAIRACVRKEIADLLDRSDPFKHRELPRDIPSELHAEADAHFFKCVDEIRGGLWSRGYDPVGDEKKELSLEEFAAAAKVELGDYVEVWRGENEFHSGKHTWEEWMRTFLQYMSW